MKGGLVIADSGSIFSLVIIDRLDILDSLFDEVKIPNAVWQEIAADKSKSFYRKLFKYFNNKVSPINRPNELALIMDYGESESVLSIKN